MASPFFGENKSNWTDMSDYVVHFAKDYDQKSAYDNMLSILGSRVIKARNPFGLVREKAPDPKSQRVACFSEVPLHRLRRLAEARSEYGIVFRKDFVVHRGANPIMYAYKDHDVTAALKQIKTRTIRFGKLPRSSTPRGSTVTAPISSSGNVNGERPATSSSPKMTWRSSSSPRNGTRSHADFSTMRRLRTSAPATNARL